jgi:hypothetical protein
MIVATTTIKKERKTMKTNMKTEQPTMVGYELSNYYFGNKPQHRGYDDNDPYSDEYRVATVEMSDGSTVYDMWCNGNLYDDQFSTEEEAKEALHDEWKDNFQEPEEEEEENDDNSSVWQEEEDVEEESSPSACFADIQNERIRQERMLEASK